MVDAVPHYNDVVFLQSAAAILDFVTYFAVLEYDHFQVGSLAAPTSKPGAGVKAMPK